VGRGSSVGSGMLVGGGSGVLVGGGFGVLVGGGGGVFVARRGLKVGVGGGSGVDVSVGGIMMMAATVGGIAVGGVRVGMVDGVTVVSGHHGVGLGEAVTVGGEGNVLAMQNSSISGSSSEFSTIS